MTQELQDYSNDPPFANLHYSNDPTPDHPKSAGLNLVHNAGRPVWVPVVTNEEAYSYLMAVANNIGSSLDCDVTSITVENEFNGQYRFQFSVKPEHRYTVRNFLSSDSKKTAANILRNYEMICANFDRQFPNLTIIAEMAPIPQRVLDFFAEVAGPTFPKQLTDSVKSAKSQPLIPPFAKTANKRQQRVKW